MEPEKARAGMPCFAAEVAAPTVPEMRVVVPRFAAKGGGFFVSRCFWGNGDKEVEGGGR